MKFKFTALQKQLLKELYTRGIISFAEARDQRLLQYYTPLKGLKLITTNQEGFVLTSEGMRIAFEKRASV